MHSYQKCTDYIHQSATSNNEYLPMIQYAVTLIFGRKVRYMYMTFSLFFHGAFKSAGFNWFLRLQNLLNYVWSKNIIAMKLLNLPFCNMYLVVQVFSAKFSLHFFPSLGFDILSVGKFVHLPGCCIVINFLICQSSMSGVRVFLPIVICIHLLEGYIICTLSKNENVLRSFSWVLF